MLFLFWLELLILQQLLKKDIQIQTTLFNFI